MIRTSFPIACVLYIALFASCDVRSGTAKREMEKFTSSPTQPVTPSPAATPAEPKDVAEVDTSLQGETIHFNGFGQKKTETCTKFNRMFVNGDKNIVTVKGVCRQIMVNGDQNVITLDAAMEIVTNGSGNAVKYSRFVNGKPPSVIENRSGNVIEKIPADAVPGDGRADTK